MKMQKKTVGIHKKELRNAGYTVVQERSDRKTFYTVISPKGKTVLEAVKFQRRVTAMNREKYLCCDKAVIKFEQGKAAIDCYTYCSEGLVVERIEETEGEARML